MGSADGVLPASCVADVPASQCNDTSSTGTGLELLALVGAALVAAALIALIVLAVGRATRRRRIGRDDQ